MTTQTKIKCPICGFKLLDNGLQYVCVDCGTYNKMRLPDSMLQKDSRLWNILFAIPFMFHIMVFIAILTGKDST